MKNEGFLSDHLELSISHPFITLQSDIISESDKKLIQTTNQGRLGQTQIAFTNICFGQVQNDSSKQQKASRIHGRQAIKKIGLGHFNLYNKQRKSNKLETTNNTTLKSSLNQSSKKLLQSKSKQFPSEMLDRRSIQLDEELNAILKSRKQNEKIHKNFTHQTSIRQTVPQIAEEGSLQLVFSVQEKEPKQQQRDTYSSTLSQREDREKGKQQDKENGFYKKLKNRLHLQMKKIQDKHQNQQYLLLSGCEVTNATRKHEEKRSLTDRGRPHTALTRTGLEVNSARASMTDRRPKSSKSRNLQRREILYMSQQLDEPTRKRNYKSMKENKHLTPYEPQTNKSYKYVQKIHKKSSYTINKGELQRERVKEKMLSILINCQRETVESIDLQAGFKAFESYTKRMNKGLNATESLISGHRKQIIDVDPSYFA